MVAALKGVTIPDVHRISTLASDLTNAAFPYGYVFIEPSYSLERHFHGSSSMHPIADIRDGEALVKTVYDALRASPIWEQSLLIITWDEHGGFYDHVKPGPATPPGDTEPLKGNNQWGFTFAQYGVRVPAIVISPFVPKGTIDHRRYDHASILKTLEDLFGLDALTDRDAGAGKPTLAHPSARPPTGHASGSATTVPKATTTTLGLAVHEARPARRRPPPGSPLFRHAHGHRADA